MSDTIRIPCPTIFPRRTTYGGGRPAEGVTTYNVPCGGTLRPCAICGAVRYCGREGCCLDEDAVTHVVRRRFLIDTYDYGIPGGVPGWTRGAHWNGWACPYFERDAALAILAKQDEGGGKSQYDETTDTMLVWTEGDDEPRRYPAEVLQTPEGPKTVYAVGSWEWIWDENDEDNAANQTEATQS